MTDRVSPKRFHETEGLEEWRVLGDGACAYFRTGSFAAGSRLAQAINGLPGVDEHSPNVDLRVLREAGFVESRIEAQRRLYRLRPEPLTELDAWLVPFRRFWSKHVDALEQHLEEMEKVLSVKGKKRYEQP